MRLRTDTLLEILDGIAPALLAEDWDNIGLLLGHPAEEVRGILIGLDPSAVVLAQARTLGCNTVITHHPAIFHPLKQLIHDRPPASLLQQATLHGLQLIACHSNLDSADGGVNDLLGEALGLHDCRPLLPAGAGDNTGMGRIGALLPSLSAGELHARIESTLRPPWILAAGRPPAQIRHVALCGGSGSSLMETAWRLGAEVYLTAEVKHADACRAEEMGIWLLDCGHFATEIPATAALGRLLHDAIEVAGYQVPLHIADEKPPLRLLTPTDTSSPHSGERT